LDRIDARRHLDVWIRGDPPPPGDAVASDPRNRPRQRTLGRHAGPSFRHSHSNGSHGAGAGRRRSVEADHPPAEGNRHVPDGASARGRAGARGVSCPPPRQPHRGRPYAGRGAVLVSPDGVVDRVATDRRARARVRRARRRRDGGADRVRRRHRDRLQALRGDTTHERVRCRRCRHQGTHRLDSRQSDRGAPDRSETDRAGDGLGGGTRRSSRHGRDRRRGTRRRTVTRPRAWGAAGRSGDAIRGWRRSSHSTPPETGCGSR
jgi:hypothetical protein